MLNDEPRPEDLPEPEPSPYAALPPEARPTAPRASRVSRPGPTASWASTLRKVVAAVAVIALLAATLLAVWGLFRSSEPVAGDAWSRTGSGRLRLAGAEPSLTVWLGLQGAGRHRLPGGARRLLHPARRLEVVR